MYKKHQSLYIEKVEGPDLILHDVHHCTRESRGMENSPHSKMCVWFCKMFSVVLQIMYISML